MSMNFIKMEDDFLPVQNVLVVPTLFPAFTTICFKDPDGFSKLTILETYTYTSLHPHEWTDLKYINVIYDHLANTFN